MKNVGIDKAQTTRGIAATTAAVAWIVVPSLLSSGCAGTPIPGSEFANTGAGQLAQQISDTQAINGMKISFHYSDFYGLTNPNSQNCAGDVRNLYDPIALNVPGSADSWPGFDSVVKTTLSTTAGATGPTGPLRFPADVSFLEQTIRPSFVKNVSVDMTDANAQLTGNRASSCSLGTTSNVPATSSCATFDFGSIGGVPSTLGGTMLVIGGVQDINYSGIVPPAYRGMFPNKGMSLSCGSVVNLQASDVATAGGAAAPTGYTQCASSIYALGVNTLPASTFQSNPSMIPSYVQGSTGPTGPISMWANLSGSQGYTGPAGSAGASVSYDQGLQQILFFGGSAPLAGLGSNAPGVTTYDTWTFDLKSQHWNQLSANVYVDNTITTLYDMFYDIENNSQAPATTTSKGGAIVSVQIPKNSGARTLFGYVPAGGMGVSVDKMNTDGVMTGGAIDATDRLMIVGGYNAVGALTGTHRFNPTYGPEIQNVLGQNVGVSTVTTKNIASGGVPISGSVPVQWIDSYHTQLTTNTYGGAFVKNTAVPTAPLTAAVSSYMDQSSRFAPDLPPLSVGPTGGQAVINSAFTAIYDNAASAGGSIQGTAYLLGAGGFDATTPSNLPFTQLTADPSAAGCTTTLTGATPDPITQHAVSTQFPYGTNTDLRCGGALSIQTRFGGNVAEANTMSWSSIPNFLDTITSPAAPATWYAYTESKDGTSTNHSFIDFLGGQTMLPGFNLATNDVVIFGGIDCRAYVSDSGAPCKASIGSGTPGAGNIPGSTSYGRYFQFGANPIAGALNVPTDVAPRTATATALAWIQSTAPTGTLPRAAGMAAARGEDPAGNIMIVAWGGAVGGATPEGLEKVYYLTNTSATVTAPTGWGYATPSNSTVKGTYPPELINSAMVFSHVTKKFYLFGGYDPTGTTRGETYELSVTSPGSQACNAGQGSGNCVFTWRQLTQSTGAGLTCYPSSCPQARRSHRMAEVNYFNRNPSGLNGNTTGQQNCFATAPCSYGIFMEGGTPDGVNYLSDRWMFDPTANGGNGHWQLVNEMPPRTLAAMTSVDYALPTNGQVVHRAIMFGGETGMHNPQWAAQAVGSDQFFVAPTLGDTWMFDYDSQSWNRVNLLGKGYDAGGSISQLPVSANTGTEFAHREAYDARNPSTYPPITATPNATLGAAYADLSPPPLSGAIMVTRTQAPPPAPLGVVSPTMPLRSLKLPEVYLFGGRTKNGGFNTLSDVYKFCAGSSGEAFTIPSNATTSVPSPTDFVCDAFDPLYNPASPGPIPGYSGRWLHKKPKGMTTALTALNQGAIASYMGAGAYDPVRDRIVLFGGLSSGTLSAVTDTNNLFASADIYEYTPPQPQLSTSMGSAYQTGVEREGAWTHVPSCSGFPAPAGRYGHSMAYNSLGQNIIIMGGYDADGQALTTPINDYSSNTVYNAPQVWTGTYCSSANCDSKVPLGTNITNAPCYYWQEITIYGNSTAIQSQLPPETGLSHAASVYIPATGYNLGYYAMFDRACSSEGPIVSPDSSLNRLLAGGAYIDIDRTQLGTNENLLLNISYMPLGPGNINPDSTSVTPDQAAVFKVHLIRTGQTQDQLQGAFQPRYMGYTDTQQFPEIVQTLSVLAPPTGQMAQEQVLLPISIDPRIDRIRIERYSGSGILLDASIFRMGTK